MAQFSINTNRVKGVASDEYLMVYKLGGYSYEIKKIANGLDMNSPAASGIRSSLRSAAEKAERHSKSMRGMESALNSIADKYDSTERSVRDSSQFGALDAGVDASISNTSSATGTWVSRILGEVGGIMENILSSIRTGWQNLAGNIAEIIRSAGKTDTTDKQPTAEWAIGLLGGAAVASLGGSMVQGSAKPGNGASAGASTTQGSTTTGGGAVSSPSSGDVIGTSAGGAPKYELPEYTKNFANPDDNHVQWKNGGCGSVSYRNWDGKLSCTYYTLRKLKERGLGYPCIGGPGNGNSWYKNFDKDSGLPNASGEDALQKLAGSLQLPQENIVVSFDKEKYGHVLLIDEMYRDANGNVRVKYSEMFGYAKVGSKLANLNDKNPQVDLELNAFISRYKTGGGMGYTINGAAVLGAAHT